MNRLNRPVVVGAGVAVVVIVLAWWFLLWSPRNKSYNEANDAAQLAQGQVEQLQAQLNRLESIKQQIPQLEAELAKMQVAVPDQPQLDQIILSINDAATQSGLELDSISPTPPAIPTRGSVGSVGAAAPPSIRVSLALKGGYDQLLDFMNRLNGLPRLLVIDTLGVTSANTGATATPAAVGAPLAAELTVSITVRLFVTTAPPAAGATTTTTSPSGGGSTATTSTTVAGGGVGATTSTTAPTTATTGGTTGG